MLRWCMPDDVLILRDCAKRFGDTVALDGASLSLAKGEWLGLLGPNGAGKTTLIRAVAGRINLDRGSITMPGAPTSPRRRGASPPALGMVPQTIALYPLLTAAENLHLFGTSYGMTGPELRRAVGWALEWTGLSGRAGEPIKMFSVGMKRRLNLACGILHRPSVILLDEPLVGVDPHSHERILEMLEQLRENGASFLYATHQLNEAERVCGRIAILDHGRVIALGTLAELVTATVGAGQRVAVTLDAPLPDTTGLTAFRQHGVELMGQLSDIGIELPLVIAHIYQAGRQIKGLRVESPSLASVFIHLTGRNLRE